MHRTPELEEKLKSVGSGFYGLYDENRIFCNVISYPDRGPLGDAAYRGNSSHHLACGLILRFKCNRVFDPTEGSGTVKDVVYGINRCPGKNIDYEGSGPKEGWDLLSDPLPEKLFDMEW